MIQVSSRQARLGQGTARLNWGSLLTNEAHYRRNPGHRRTRGRGNETTRDQGTEQYCKGRGTGPGHARLVAQGTNSVAAMAQ